MTADVVHPGKIDIGRVIGETFGVLRRNILTFAVLSFLLSGVPLAIVNMFQATAVQPGGELNFNSATLMWAGFGGLAAIVTTAILQGTLIYATVQDLSGGKASIGESLATGLRAFLPLLIVSILFFLAMFFGLILLVVPGIMIGIAWCVCVPALVAERTGIFGAFGRAAELTRGNRWRIFGLVVVVWIILLVIGMVLGAISGLNMLALAGDPAAAQAAAQAAALSPLTITINVISNTLSGVITSAGIAVLYVELRRAREGLGPQWLAEIFA
jgi:hypothetical protein